MERHFDDVADPALHVINIVVTNRSTMWLIITRKYVQSNSVYGAAIWRIGLQ